MAEYINIKGQNIEVVASDPANPTVGQIWYNSTSNTLKAFNLTTVGAWATGGNLVNGKSSHAAANNGTQTASVTFGGYGPPASPGITADTQNYDGSSWTTSGNMGSARYDLGGAGTQTAALAIAGFTASPYNKSVIVEAYDGSTWSPAPSLTGSLISRNSGLGTQTAALNITGAITSGFDQPAISACEEYDGTSWTSTGSVGTARSFVGTAGIQTAGLAIGGNSGVSPPNVASALTEEYNGSTWTAGGAMATARSNLGGAGTQTAGLAFGGDQLPGSSDSTEEYDGTSWTAGGTLPFANNALRGAGTSNTAALSIGGNGTPTKTTTLEYNGAGQPNTVTITAS